MPNAFQKLAKRAKDLLRSSKGGTKAFLQDERSGHSDPFKPLATYHEGLRRLKDHFDPEAAARRDAFEEPNIVSDQQASYEHELAVGLQKLIIDLQTSLGSYVKNVQDDLNQGLPHEPTIESNVILAQVSTERKSRWTTWTQRLEDARKTVKNARVGLQAFKTDNPSVISRMAKHPPVAVAAVWMTAFAVVEGVSNYLFLLGTGAQTPAESISICATTALLNLFCGAVLIGFLGIRYLSHAQSKERWKGRIFILIGVCAVLTLHLGLAHFRMAIDGLADLPDAGSAGINGQLFGHVSSTTWDTLRKAPLSFLRDIHSIIVFIAGCAFAAVAAFEGYFLLGDPYPGYQRVDDAYLDALDALSSLQDEFATGVTQLTQRAIDTIDKALHEDQERHNWIKAHLTDVSAPTSRSSATSSLAVSGRRSTSSTVYSRTKATSSPTFFMPTRKGNRSLSSRLLICSASS